MGTQPARTIAADVAVKETGVVTTSLQVLSQEIIEL